MHHDCDLLAVPRQTVMPPLGTVCRLGLATRGNGELDREVSVALMAPADSRELTENLQVLSDWRALTADEHGALRAHGNRVRRRAGSFP